MGRIQAHDFVIDVHACPEVGRHLRGDRGERFQIFFSGWTKDIDLLIPPEQVDAIRAVAKDRGFLLEAGPITFRDSMELRRLTKYEGSDLVTLDLILVNPTVEEAWRSRRRVATLRGTLGGGRVGRGVFRPGPPQIRTCRFPASGSSGQ